MNTDKSITNTARSPFPGINPFSYTAREVFFARETEALRLIRMIVIHRGVLLYSESGVGKSSLINSRLLPLAIEEGYNPERIRVQPRSGEEIIVERISTEVDGHPPFLPSIFASDDQAERMVLPIEDFLTKIRDCPPDRYPLLIFDQFEEWVTQFEAVSAGQAAQQIREIQNNIKEAILSLINDGQLRVKILLSLREDYLARLNPFFERSPSLPDQYLRLTPLDCDQIYRVIRGPFEKYPGAYPAEISKSLAESIQREFEERIVGGEIRLTEVQIVCMHLFDAGKRVADLEQYYVDEAGVQGILESYLESALESLEDDQKEPAVALLSRMVTSQGTRNVISQDDLVGRVESEDEFSKETLNKTLQSLESQAKLVRRERRRDVYYYEIASEFLVAWIAKKARERAEKLAQKELLENSIRLKEKSRKRRTAIMALLLLCILLFVSVIFAVHQTFVAINEREKAVLAKNRAIANALAFSAFDDKNLVRKVLARQAFIFNRGQVMNEVDRALFKIFGRNKKSLNGGQGIVKAIAFRTPDGHLLASGRQDNTIGLWDIGDPQNLEPLPALKLHGGAVLALAFSPQKPILASGSADTTVILWDISNPSSTKPLLQDKKLDKSGKEEFKLKGHDSAVLTAAFSPDGNLLATGSADHTVILWDVKSPGNTIIIARLKGHEGKVLSLAFSPEGSILATASADSTVILWDLTDLHAKKERSLSAINKHKDAVNSVAFHPDGKRLATGSNDHRVLIWNVEDPGKPEFLHELKEHENPVLSLAISPDGRYLSACCADNNQRVWDLKNMPAEPPLMIGIYENRGRMMAYSPDNKTLAAITGEDDTIFLVPRSEVLAESVCEKASRNLSIQEWQTFVGLDKEYQLTCSNFGLHYSFLQEGMVLAMQDKRDEAVKRFRKSLELDPGLAKDMDPEAEANHWAEFNSKISEIIKDGDITGVIALFDKEELQYAPAKRSIGEARQMQLKEVRKKTARELIRQGVVIAKTGKLDAAEFFNMLKAFESELDQEIDKAKGEIAANLVGEVINAAPYGRLDDALTKYKQIKHFRPQQPIPAELLNTLCLWGALWNRADDVTFACDALIQLDPENAGYYYNRAIAYATIRNKTEAIHNFQNFSSIVNDKDVSSDIETYIDALKEDNFDFFFEKLPEWRTENMRRLVSSGQHPAGAGTGRE